MNAIMVRVKNNKVVIGWYTNNAAISVVFYKKDTASSWKKEEETKIVQNHTIRLSKKDLLACTYFYKVYNRDEHNQEIEKSVDDLGNILMFIIQ